MRITFRQCAIILIPAMMLCSSCREDAPTKPDPVSGPGPILFVSNQTGVYQLYSMNTNGSNVQRLTNDPGFPIGFGAWSPDGKKIAVTSSVGGVQYYGPALYVMNADGSGLHKLTNGSAERPEYATGGRPAWSPDGRRIAFQRVMYPEAYGNTDIFVINDDGTGERRLTETTDTAESIGGWSGDGQSLYVTYFDYTVKDSSGVLLENSRIARVDLDRDSVVDVSSPGEVCTGAVGSPDNSLIVFSLYAPSGAGGGVLRPLCVMNADGTHQRTLTRNGYRYESAAAWSPDGREILYNGENNELVPYQNPPRDIVIIGKEGGTPRIITPFDFRAAVSIATSWRKE